MKKGFFIFIISLIFVSMLGVCASDYDYTMEEVHYILDNIDESELTGCCSVVYQMDGNNSIMSFRRDAENGADIHIEKVDNNGTKAIKQYKVDGGYFCQVIITSDGWVIGCGGIDDGDDNKKIEGILWGMINSNNTISDSGLAQIEQIKKPYKLGHVVIKAPNGNYGIATDKGHFTGKLEPGQYISMPNRYTYFRSGDISLNTTDKIGVMTELAASDMFGLTRRDITTFHFHSFENDTQKGNITDMYVSNDDGSMFGMSTGGLYDDVYLPNETIKGDTIPIAPKYESMGSIEFLPEEADDGGSSNVVFLMCLVAFILFVGLLYYVLLRFITNMRRGKRRRR